MGAPEVFPDLSSTRTFSLYLERRFVPYCSINPQKGEKLGKHNTFLLFFHPARIICPVPARSGPGEPPRQGDQRPTAAQEPAPWHSLGPGGGTLRGTDSERTPLRAAERCVCDVPPFRSSFHPFGWFSSSFSHPMRVQEGEKERRDSRFGSPMFIVREM